MPPPPSSPLPPFSQPQALPPLQFKSVVPPPYYPMPSTPTSPLPPFSQPQALWAVLMVSPVDRHFHFGFISPAYTGPISHCLPLIPFCPSSILMTSVVSTFVIPFCFFFTSPLPYAIPPTPIYLSQKRRLSWPIDSLVWVAHSLLVP